jgi:hypothetical protein
LQFQIADSNLLRSITAWVVWEAWHTHLLQDIEQRAKLGEAGLEKIQADEAGEPEPVGRVEVGQQQRDHNKRPGHDAYNALDVKFFFHGMTPFYFLSNISAIFPATSPVSTGQAHLWV